MTAGMQIWDMHASEYMAFNSLYGGIYSILLSINNEKHVFDISITTVNKIHQRRPVTPISVYIVCTRLDVMDI